MLPTVPELVSLLPTLPPAIGPALRPVALAEAASRIPPATATLPAGGPASSPSFPAVTPSLPVSESSASVPVPAGSESSALGTGGAEGSAEGTSPGSTTDGSGTGGSTADPSESTLWDGIMGGLEEAVRTATGPVGLAIIFTYSFLIAFVLPLPSEVVLAAPLRLGLPGAVQLALIMVISGAGKAAGSVFAFYIGHGAKQSGPVIRLLRRSRFDVVEWSERNTVKLARQYGYVGLALALSVPGFPDTLSIYAFSVLGEDYAKFAAATFAGSVGRLLITVAVVGGAIVAI